MANFHLKENLVSACEGNISPPELARLIFFCRGVCESHLRTFRPYIVALCQQENVSLSDLAYECIAPVFSLDAHKRFFRIHAFAGSLPKALVLIEEQSLFISFRSFLVKIINVEIANYHVELDPIGAKIVRGLKLAVKHSPDARISETPFGFALEPLHRPLLDASADYPADRLERELVVRKSMSKPLPGFVHDIVSVLSEQDEYCRSIPLYELVLLRKKYLQLEEKELLTKISSDQKLDLLFSPDEISRLKGQSIRFMERKVSTVYAETDKMNPDDLSVLKDVLRKIIDGWFAGDGDEKRHIDQLRRSLPLTKQEYDRLWKNRVDYCVKLIKIYIKEKIAKEH